MLEHAPQFTTREASRLLGEMYGFVGDVEPLPSERDQNFLSRPTDGSAPFVLKIANAGEDPRFLEAQQCALAHLATTVPFCPKVFPDRDGGTSCQVTDAAGRSHAAWRVAYLPGRLLAHQRYRSPELWRDLGASVGKLTNALAGFDHPAIHREFPWDLLAAPATVARHLPLLVDPALREAITACMAGFAERASLIGELPRSAIHGDLNDHNILVGGGADRYSRGQSVTGVLDFGDMIYSATIGELAVAGAYAVLGTRDPLRVIGEMVRGYAQVRHPSDEELAALFDLLRARLCLSACMAAHQQGHRPEDAYLGVSQAGVRASLPALARIPAPLATAAIRAAAGRESAPARDRVIRYLAGIAGKLAPVVIGQERAGIIDLGVGSALIESAPGSNDEPHLTPRLADELARRGAAIGLGCYDEPRLLYTSAAFGPEADPGAERRTIHLGIDLFAPAGTPIHAPLDGVIHAFHDNNSPLDYGPVIILEHRTDDGVPFYSLYGHLARGSLDGTRIGGRIARGAAFAIIGTPAENVGWTPHLHIQLIVDLLGMGTDFPGVGFASAREFWLRLSPDPNLLLGIDPRRFPAPPPSADETLAARRGRLGPSLSIAYRKPVKAVRGWKQWIYDHTGRRYLDAYNNVPHVGHCHPVVVDAIARQARLLNTNTRYLSDLHQEYAEALCATLPPPLRTCFFLSSASEANELALRLARTVTGRRDMIVLEAAYHGNTTSLIDLSPYKHGGPGGEGAPDWVHVAPLPDDYRGPFRRGEPGVGRRYAAGVASIVSGLQAQHRTPAGFIAETCPSVAGQIFLPEGYLAATYEAVRAAGGVVIADEVQTGLGRIGTHFWAFQAHGVVPDIVVMGKPLGNGFPLAAVVTSAAIAGAFDNGMEFFSTFGGNQVALAAGLAVLRVMREEGLQEHALGVGAAMLAALRPLMETHPAVGDVRGSGLFLGVELVRDRDTREPDAEAASYISNRMREESILLGTDGPFHNVVKIRPPMPFDASDGQRLVATLERILQELA